MSTWLTPATTNASFFPQVGTQVTITGSGGGSGAVVYAITTSGVITGFNIVSGGSGYSGTLTVAITGSGSGATATATQSGGVINAVTPVLGGTGYTGGAITWRLNIAGNPWDTLLGYCGNWPSAVNGNQQKLANLVSVGVGNGTVGWSLGADALSSLTVALANGANQNVNIGSASVIYVTGTTGAFSIGGFTGGLSGRPLTVIVTSAGVLTVTDQDSGSTLGNQVLIASGTSFVCANNFPVLQFIYDALSGYWRLLAPAVT